MFLLRSIVETSSKLGIQSICQATEFYIANSGKEPRGIRGFAIVGGTATFNLWKLQGNQVSSI